MKEYSITKEKGDIGVMEVMLDLTKKGYKIFTTISEHLPFDFVAFKNNKFYKIQAKYRSEVNGIITVPLRTSWSDKNGSHNNFYDKEDIDYISIYCPETEKCYYVRIKDFDNTTAIILRLNTPKNNQTKGVKLANDYLDITDTVETTSETPEMVKI